MTINKKYLIPLSLLFSLWLYMTPGYASEDEQLNAQNEHKHTTTLLRVWASIGPLTYLDHAKVTIRNARKEVIATGITTSRGTLSITISEEDANMLPLTVSTSGGQENGVAFLGHLSAEVSDVGKDASIVHVGILSTVATRLAKWKDTYPEALTAIRAKLGISPYAPVDVLRVHNNYVDYAKLQAFVVQLSGFDKLIDKMVQAVESDTKITWPNVKPSIPLVNKASITVANSTSMLASAAPTSTSVMASTAPTSTTCTTAVGTGQTAGSTSTQVIEDFGVIAGTTLLKSAGMPSAAITASTDLVGMMFGAPPAVSADKTALANIQAELDCISSQLSYLQVELGALMVNDAMTNANACANGGTTNVSTEWSSYQYIINNDDGTAANAIAPTNSMVVSHVPNWQNLQNCSGAINAGLFPVGGSGLISGWQQMNTNMQNGTNWYTSTQVQQLQAFLSYWGTMSYQAFTLNNEYYNYMSSNSSLDYTNSIRFMTGMAYDSFGNPTFNENGVPECFAGTTSTSTNFCAYQSNIANAFPGDLYSDEIGLFNGVAVNTYPAGLAAPLYGSNGKTVVTPNQLGIDAEQLYYTYENFTGCAALSSPTTQVYNFSNTNCPLNWTLSNSFWVNPSIDAFNSQGINPIGDESAVESFTSPQKPRTLTLTQSTVSALKNSGPSGVSSNQFFLSALQADPSTAFTGLNTGNVSFTTGDQTSTVNWEQCMSFPGTNTATYGVTIAIPNYQYHCSNSINGPYIIAMLGRSFWPGAVLATSYTPPIPLTTATVVPGSPTGTTATASSAGSMSVGFTAPAAIANQNLPITFLADCWMAGGKAGDFGNPTATSGISPIIVTGLNANTSYQCSVAAINAVGQGTYSIQTLSTKTPDDALQGAPSTPTSVLFSEATPGLIDVSYAAPSNTGSSAITGYTASCSAPGYPTCTGTALSTIFNIGLSCANGVQYQCSVAAKNAMGNGTHSSAQTPETIPGAPTNLSLTSDAAAATITGTFTAPSNNGGSPITNYYMLCTDTLNGWTTASWGSPITVPTYYGVTTYSCVVQATNAYGYGLNSTASLITVQAVSPRPPTITSLTSTFTSITANFTAPGNNGGSPITGYLLTCANTSSGVSSTATGTTSPITLSGLTSGAPYSCTEQAQNAVGYGSSSAASSITTISNLPSAPTNVVFSQPGSNKIQVSFSPPTNIASVPVTSYTLKCTGTTTLTSTGTTSPLSVSHAANCLVPGMCLVIESCQVYGSNANGKGTSSAISVPYSLWY